MDSSSALTRRALIGGLMAMPLAAQATRGSLYAYVGCYTEAARQGTGDGIHVYRVDPQTAEWTQIQHVGHLVNPSFLVMSADQRHLYSVHGDETYATAFSVSRESGILRSVNQAATGGRNGVSQGIDPSGRFMVVANYGSGNVAVLPIRRDGGLSDAVQVVALQGKPGPNKVEQTGSHPHNIVFDPSGRFVMVPDKGLDRVFVFRMDADAGKLVPTEQGSVAARAGSGPRHGAFHPNRPFAWVVNEMGSTITTFAWDEQRGSLKPLQILPTLPADFTGESTCAEIAVSTDGRFVYGSNRGHDSVVMFTCDPNTGLLSSPVWTSTRGRTPRYVGFDPSHSLFCAANQDSHTVITYRVDSATGRLTVVGSPVQNASPVTIAFASL